MSKENPPPVFQIPQLDVINQKLDALLIQIKEQQTDVLDDYITKSEFLERFGIKEGMLYKLINDQKLQVYRINRKIYFKQSEIDSALQKGLLK